MVGEKSWWLFDDSEAARQRAQKLPEEWRATEAQYQAELDALEAALTAAEARTDASAPAPADGAVADDSAPVAETAAADEEAETVTEVTSSGIAADEVEVIDEATRLGAASAIEELHSLLESGRESAYESSLDVAHDSTGDEETLSGAARDAASRWVGVVSHLRPLPSLNSSDADNEPDSSEVQVIDASAETDEQVALTPVEPVSPLQQMMRNIEAAPWRVEVPGEPPLRREAPMIATAADGGKTALLAPFATPATKSRLREGLSLAHARIIELLGENDHAVVAVCSAYAGEGKTTMALALADMLADEFPRQMLLIDAHLRSPGVHGALDVADSPGTKDCLEHGAVVSGAIRWSGRHWVMPAGNGPIDPTALTWEGERGLLRTLRALFRVTIVDMPAVMAHAQEASLLARWADGVVWVAAAAEAPADAVSSAVEVVGREKLLGVVLNKRRAALPGWLERLF